MSVSLYSLHLNGSAVGCCLAGYIAYMKRNGAEQMATFNVLFFWMGEGTHMRMTHMRGGGGSTMGIKSPVIELAKAGWPKVIRLSVPTWWRHDQVGICHPVAKAAKAILKANAMEHRDNTGGEAGGADRHRVSPQSCARKKRSTSVVFTIKRNARLQHRAEHPSLTAAHVPEWLFDRAL